MWFLDAVTAELSKPTFLFGIPLWVLICFAIGVLLLLILFLLCCCCIPSCCCCCCRKKNPPKSRVRPEKPLFRNPTFESKDGRQRNPGSVSSSLPSIVPDVQIDVEGAEVHHRVVYSPRRSSYSGMEDRSLGEIAESSSVGVENPARVSGLGWVNWFTKKEMEEATNGFSDNNVIGNGVYGTVYLGVLQDNTRVAVKRLVDNRGHTVKDFSAEVESIGRIRHKNLVRLLGYCVEGSHRMLVYEYVENSNLNQWLHGDLIEDSLLTWEIRMKIILGTAKALAYLHEGLEPKVVHRDIKSCNILLDRQWNPKISEFGLAKLLDSERTHVTTRVVGTYGYVAPEYACTGMLNERSDIFSFGVLVMEIVSGRKPVDYTRPAEEMNLVEWLKKMVADRCYDEILDPKLSEIPTSKALKRVLLIAIRCVDPDAEKRPKMGRVVHMLETGDMLSSDGPRVGRGTSRSQRDHPKEGYVVPRSSI